MPFKIIQTIEGGETCLSVVPSKWEADGILYWPKKHLVAKLSLQEDSAPSEKWEKLNCVKKRELPTRAAAYAELERMEGRSDTEMDENTPSNVLPQKKARRAATKNVFFDKMDFNSYVEQNNPADQTAQEEVTEETVFINTGEVNVNPNPGQIESGVAAHNPVPQIIYLEPNNIVQNVEPNDSIGAVLANQTMILENQHKMMQIMAKLITSMDYLSQTISEGSMHHNVPVGTSMEEGFNPVNSLEELDTLENSLKDESMMMKYIRSMSFICGSTGKSNGLDCCYKLVDYFITRQFLLQCSWTGNTRPGGSKTTNDQLSSVDDNGKVALKFYKKFRGLFLKLIMLADKDFSELECDMFFKRIMKNSKQRVMAKMTTSKHRNRPKNIKYKDRKEKPDEICESSNETAMDDEQN